MIKNFIPHQVIPSLETERLILRGHKLSDFSASAQMWSRPEVVRYISGTPSSEQVSWSRYLNYQGHWATFGCGYWMVERKSNGEFVGELGFADFKRDMNPSIQGIPEAGWVLRPECQGEGLASEALAGALNWARAHFIRNEIVCIISPENLASIRVAEKAGFKQQLLTEYQSKPTLLFKLVLG